MIEAGKNECDGGKDKKSEEDEFCVHGILREFLLKVCFKDVGAKE